MRIGDRGDHEGAWEKFRELQIQLQRALNTDVNLTELQTPISTYRAPNTNIDFTKLQTISNLAQVGDRMFKMII